MLFEHINVESFVAIDRRVSVCSVCEFKKKKTKKKKTFMQYCELDSNNP